MTIHIHVFIYVFNTSIPHSDSNHRLSGKTSIFSTLTALFIHSQSARDLELYKRIQIT